jgi:hypothetical protein
LFVVVCGDFLSCGCCGGPGCSSEAKNGELSATNSETDIIVMPRVIMSVNVVRQCRANVSSRKTSDELLSMCASIFAVAMKTFSAFLPHL